MSGATKSLLEILSDIMPHDRWEAYRDQIRKQDEIDAKLISDLRRECLNAMGLLIDAARSPRIAKQDITEALETLRRALKWAEELER